MTKEVKKGLILLQEYKQGFAEIQKLVDSFEAIQPDSQETFIKERIGVLKEQLKYVQAQKYDVFLEVRSFLSKVNSKIKTHSDMETFIKSQIEECETFNDLLKSSNGNGSENITNDKP